MAVIYELGRVLRSSFHARQGESMSKTIMIADDSMTVLKVLSSTLSEAGYTVLEAQNGEDALHKISGRQIDALITDLNMPKMCGVELIKSIRANGGNRFTPIIMLTSEACPEQAKIGKSAGASAWLTKPFKAEQILSVVSMVCPL